MNIEKRNIFLENTKEEMPYSSVPKRGGTHFPVRNDPEAHVNGILRKLEACNQQSLSDKQVAAIRYKEGLYLEFSGCPENDLNTRSLENRNQGIRLLNIRNDGNTVKATVFIPSGKETYFLQKAESYKNTLNLGDKPRNNDLIRSIENIQVAVVESFWVGNPNLIPNTTKVWCEVWLRSEGDGSLALKSFDDFCEINNLYRKKELIKFPERMVVMLLANRDDLQKLIMQCGYIAEFRKAPEVTSFFEKLSGVEQQQWVNELLERVKFNESNSSVCLLDTGITTKHPILRPAVLEDGIQAVNPSWIVDDEDGHGTCMAGIALYNDLKSALLTTESVAINHKLESVKIFHPKEKNEPELYGEITKQAILLAEITNANVDRSICMSITADSAIRDGRPSSWSGAVDSITSGADGDSKRLVIISAGDVYPYEFTSEPYPNANILHTIEDPGQAWNALTIGAYNNDVAICDPYYSGWSSLADVGELSPYSSTSKLWDKKWPIKPEVLFDGSNVATNGVDYTECSDFSLLTTGKNFLSKPFDNIWATSAAAAQAAYMAAELYAAYPGIWPETIRALIVHSANWTEAMKKQFCENNKKTSGRRNLLRTCGYGIPSLEKAIQCANNSVNMVIQGALQPFIKKSSKQPSMFEMHLHTIPWPKEILESLGDTPVMLKVTLSYFIEPGPGEIGWKDRYRYPSCGLRFEVNNGNETVEDLKKRINKLMREDENDKGNGTSGSDRWYLGSENRDVGSIHSDFMELNAVDLCEMNHIAVYPVIGWWRERYYLGKCNESIRYSLIVTISTPESEVDLYTPIITQISTEISVNV